MSNSNSPSSYWSREHGQKQAYPDPFTADRAAMKLTEDRAGSSFYPEGTVWESYVCNWGQRYQDGRTAETHWHIGRRGKRMTNDMD
jgi:hypothetical protein